MGNQVWTVFVGNILEQLHWKGLWQVFDRHKVVVDSFIPRKRSVDGSRLGFVRMGSKEEAGRVMDILDGRWIYGSYIRVSWAIKGGRNSFWWWKRFGQSMEMVQSEMGTNEVQSGPIASVVGVMQPEFMEVLQHCAIGWCRQPISNRTLTEEMKVAAIDDAHVMRISCNRFLIIFESAQARERVLAFTMLEKWFERVEIGGNRVCVTEAELLLRGLRIGNLDQREESDSDQRESTVWSEASTTGNSQAIEAVEEKCANQMLIKVDGKDEALRVNPRGSMNLETTGVDGPLISVELGFVGPFYVGSSTEVVMFNGTRWKIRMLDEVIRSVQSPEEVEAEAQRKKKGRGRPRKASVALAEIVAIATSSGIADITISDSDFIHRQEAILREATATVNLGKLIGATTIGNDKVIINDIARLFSSPQ
ncbi:hypothetical protein V6N13_076230 [Hibiscus sabdariffa]